MTAVLSLGALAWRLREQPVPDRASQAARGRKADGWTVDAIASELGCSRRTVQRYLRIAA